MDGALKFRLDLDNADFVNNANVAGATTRTLTTGAKGTMGALKALQGPMQLIGFSIAPQLTSNLTMAAGAMKGLEKAGAAFGISLGPLTVALAGIGATAAILTEKFKAQRAEAEFDVNQQATLENLNTKFVPGLNKVMDRLVAGGFMSSREADAFRGLMDANKENPQWLLDAVKSIQASLAPVVKNETQAFARGDLNKAMEMMGRGLLPKAEQERLKIADEINKQVTELLPLARAAGVSPAAIVNLGERLFAARTADLNLKPEIKFGTRQASDLERMGFVFAAGGSAVDYQRRIAETSQKSLVTLERIYQRLGSPATSTANV